MVTAILLGSGTQSHAAASMGASAPAQPHTQAPASNAQTPTEADFQRSHLAGVPVLASKTDPGITVDDSVNYLYVNRQIVLWHQANLPTDRHQLVLFMTGTGGHWQTAIAFSQLAANLGYHVIFLNYVDDIPASICARDPDATEFERFRMAIIAGGVSRYITVSREDSIENRVEKLLGFASKYWPREQWDQFLNSDGGIKWDSVVVGGQSQGGGHAALIAIKHYVARVVCTGAPKDFSLYHNSPAAWYSDPSATSKDRFFAYNGLQDYQGCTPAGQLQNLHVLGLQQFGGPVDIDDAKPPYNHSRMLFTDWPGGKLASSISHTSVIRDDNPNNVDVWTYMLTEPVK